MGPSTEEEESVSFSGRKSWQSALDKDHQQKMAAGSTPSLRLIVHALFSPSSPRTALLPPRVTKGPGHVRKIPQLP